MRYKLFGRTGLRVSELCLGAMTFGDAANTSGWGVPKEEVAPIVEAFAEAGGNFIDTANYYGRGESERILGELIAPEREQWVLSTKYTLNMRPNDPNGGGTHRKSLVQALESSLRRLRTEYIDVYWVHIWDAFTPVEEVVRALDDAVTAGKVLYVGISDTPVWSVAQAVTLADLRGWTRFAGLQVPYSLVERSAERDLLPMADALELTVTAWSPLGGGLLTGRYGSDRDRPDDTRIAAFGDGAVTQRNLAVADCVNAVALERGASSAQVAIAWLLAQQARSVIVPILGARRLGQLEDNLGALELELSPDELARLDDASRIELGFPHDFGAARLAYGNTGPLIGDHRRRMAVPQAITGSEPDPSKGEAMTAQHTITVHLVCRDAARAADWYVRALGAEERGRVPVPDGRFMQIELRFGDSTVMIADEFPEMGVVSPLTVGGVHSTLSLHSNDVETLWQRALEAGAEEFQPLQDMFWGDRHGEIIDPFGHKWALAQHLRDVPPEEIRAAAAAMFGGQPS
jgi:aryl-alcohol dehydrogenase-like predicted oxidoreductase/uncharacterized glyoxalase superfamily protein PhnB